MSEWVVSADRIENFARLKEAGADAVLIGTDFYSARAMACIAPVSYTHLDVYKRQVLRLVKTQKP